MRWCWIDRFTEFASGQHAVAVKNVSLAEEQLTDHFPGYPVMPNSLIVEGMAQTAGLLVSEYNDFRERVVLAKLSKCLFYFPVRAGQTLTYRAKILHIKQDGAMVATEGRIAGELQTKADIFFAHLDSRDSDRELFEPIEFLTWLKVLGVFEVGVKADGTPLKIPPWLAEAELRFESSNSGGQAGETARAD